MDKDVEVSYEDLVAAIKRNREVREPNFDIADKVNNRQFQTIIQGNDICRINLNTGEVEKLYTKEEQPILYDYIEKQNEIRKLS